MGDMERDHGIKLKYNTALRSQNAAYDFIYGDHKKSWELLPAYFHMSMKENPGTSAYIETDKDDVFEYAFISFNASAGFLSYCRPVIVIEGTHLKGKYKGILFVATTKDGNEQIFPLAFGIGDKECHSAWMWFLQKLRSTFGCPKNLVVVSDRHPSIKSAMEVVYPEAVHAICSYHLRQNIRSHGSKAVGLYMKASYTYSPVVYEKSMAMLAAKYPNTKKVVVDEAIPTRWARSQCPVRRYSFMTSNACEAMPLAPLVSLLHPSKRQRNGGDPDPSAEEGGEEPPDPPEEESGPLPLSVPVEAPEAEPLSLSDPADTPLPLPEGLPEPLPDLEAREALMGLVTFS
ncbi:Unknown protein [Striga hermonthica]|uniref:MULE transposase domain-containing protein n=1 Tax=Striga hermonthica TaxID=68872 RepID=A0A9N7P086_STRHE|nr:Unknown protein [Striga hermonthica]